MACLVLHNGTAILPDGLLADALVLVEDGRIASIMSGTPVPRSYGSLIDLGGGYVAPGFIDLHVHGGAGADFMDGTHEAFTTACRAHARHGTTSLLPTTTAAEHEQHLAFLAVCRALKEEGTGGAAILGAHLYGPYFASEARGCHPA